MIEPMRCPLCGATLVEADPETTFFSTHLREGAVIWELRQRTTHQAIGDRHECPV